MLHTTYRRWVVLCQTKEYGNVTHPLVLLRARRDRPRGCRAAEQRDEIAPPQFSIFVRPPHRGPRAPRPVLLSPKVLCDALHRASPEPERPSHLQDTHTLRKLFRTFRSVALSIFGRPSFTPWATAS